MNKKFTKGFLKRTKLFLEVTAVWEAEISVTGWKNQFQSVQLFLCFVVVTLTTRKDRNGQINLPNYPESHQRQTKKTKQNTNQTQKQTKTLKIWVPKMIFVLGISKDRKPAKQITWKDISKNSASRPNVSKPFLLTGRIHTYSSRALMLRWSAHKQIKLHSFKCSRYAKKDIT